MTDPIPPKAPENKAAQEIARLRDDIIRMIDAEAAHKRLIGHRPAYEADNTSRDEIDLAYADFLDRWTSRRVKLLLNKAQEALDPDLAADRRADRMRKRFAPRRGHPR